MNWASAETGAVVIGVSSEIKGCEAENVLVDEVSKIWLTEEGLPQWICISLQNIPRLPQDEIEIRTIGWYCWHAYSTNPKEVRVHVSRDGAKFRIWDTLYVKESKIGPQLFCCSPISIDIYPYIAFEILATFHGLQTYLNRIYFYSEEMAFSSTGSVNNDHENYNQANNKVFHMHNNSLLGMFGNQEDDDEEEDEPITPSYPTTNNNTTITTKLSATSSHLQQQQPSRRHSSQQQQRHSMYEQENDHQNNETTFLVERLSEALGLAVDESYEEEEQRGFSPQRRESSIYQLNPALGPLPAPLPSAPVISLRQSFLMPSNNNNNTTTAYGVEDIGIAPSAVGGGGGGGGGSLSRRQSAVSKLFPEQQDAGLPQRSTSPELLPSSSASRRKSSMTITTPPPLSSSSRRVSMSNNNGAIITSASVPFSAELLDQRLHGLEEKFQQMVDLLSKNNTVTNVGTNSRSASISPSRRQSSTVNNRSGSINGTSSTATTTAMAIDEANRRLSAAMNLFPVVSTNEPIRRSSTLSASLSRNEQDIIRQSVRQSLSNIATTTTNNDDDAQNNPENTQPAMRSEATEALLEQILGELRETGNLETLRQRIITSSTHSNSSFSQQQQVVGSSSSRTAVSTMQRTEGSSLNHVDSDDEEITHLVQELHQCVFQRTLKEAQLRILQQSSPHHLSPRYHYK